MSQVSRFSKIFVKIWYSKDFRSLSEDGKLLFLYLLTSPHRNMGGYYSIPTAYLCYDLNLEESRVRKALDELNHKQMVIYDYNTQIVLILKWFLYNPIENENQAKGLNKQLAELPSSDLLKVFIECVNRYCSYKEIILKGLSIPPKKEQEPFRNPSETLLKPIPKPGTGSGSGTVSGTEINTYALCSAPAQAVNDAPADDVEADKVTVQPERNPAGNPGEQRSRAPFKSRKQQEMFDAFWREYPKRRAKGNAEKAWAKISPGEQLFKAIMDGLKRAKTSAEWTGDGGRYIPYPASWLNAKGWEDEYTQPIQGKGKIRLSRTDHRNWEEDDFP